MNKKIPIIINQAKMKSENDRKSVSLKHRTFLQKNVIGSP